MMWEMIFREFERHKLRTALTALGVTIGIFLVTSISSFSEGIMYYVNEQIAITAGLIIVIEDDIPQYAMQQSEIDQDLVEEVRALVGVEDAIPIMFATIDGISITGTNPEDENIIRGVSIELADGSDFEVDKDELVLGYDYAQRNDHSVGDIIEIDDVDFEVVGILEESGDDGIDGGVNTGLLRLQRLTDKEDIVSMIMVKPASAADADIIEQAINDEFDELNAASDQSIMSSVNEMLSQLNMLTFALGSIAALISGIVIMNVMIISVRERRREIGTMKAIGATNRHILLTVLLEAVTISVSGAVVGVILGFGGATAVNSILPQSIALVTPRLIVQGILFAAFIGAVSGFIPARQAAKLDPIEAIRYE
ncbi:MAG: ABC transporter permease [Candidatus Aenigmatarchaeota archaeon]|nr:MAG: ABC transporter permease [Candidatus Aenigmarchaeota archaeon]